MASSSIGLRLSELSVLEGNEVLVPGSSGVVGLLDQIVHFRLT